MANGGGIERPISRGAAIVIFYSDFLEHFFGFYPI
jgi:hypothetical protein